MLFKPGTPLYSYEIVRESGTQVVYVNYLGALEVPSLAENPDIAQIRGATPSRWREDASSTKVDVGSDGDQLDYPGGGIEAPQQLAGAHSEPRTGDGTNDGPIGYVQSSTGEKSIVVATQMDVTKGDSRWWTHDYR